MRIPIDFISFDLILKIPAADCGRCFYYKKEEKQKNVVKIIYNEYKIINILTILIHKIMNLLLKDVLYVTMKLL